MSVIQAYLKGFMMESLENSNAYILQSILHRTADFPCSFWIC